MHSVRLALMAAVELAAQGLVAVVVPAARVLQTPAATTPVAQVQVRPARGATATVLVVRVVLVSVEERRAQAAVPVRSVPEVVVPVVQPVPIAVPLVRLVLTAAPARRASAEVHRALAAAPAARDQ